MSLLASRPSTVLCANAMHLVFGPHLSVFGKYHRNPNRKNGISSSAKWPTSLISNIAANFLLRHAKNTLRHTEKGQKMRQQSKVRLSEGHYRKVRAYVRTSFGNTCMWQVRLHVHMFQSVLFKKRQRAIKETLPCGGLKPIKPQCRTITARGIDRFNVDLERRTGEKQTNWNKKPMPHRLF